MGGLILLLLIMGVLYIAVTYLKGPRNTNPSSDDFITRPFGGADNIGIPPESDFTEDEAETDGADEYAGFEDRQEDEDGGFEAGEEEREFIWEDQDHLFDASAASTPADDAPIFDAPAASTPAADAPAGDTPASGIPAADAPTGDTTAASVPASGTSLDYTPAVPEVTIDSEVQIDAQMSPETGETKLP